ncbi:NUMOD4 domain-containing protein [Oenococcus sicerae]|uniref:NUMOD4 domain-containing protein n=1 Tax=Oenococcus sicerae TaxID=2203724 RepID=A0AAJ1R7J3_9LACO|nr:hypothetical protein [Oenococcus sicerae]
MAQANERSSEAKTVIEEWREIKGYEGLYQVSNLGKFEYA